MTKLTQNITCAMKIVVWPSGIPRLMNSVSSDEPATTSGVAIGRKIRMLATALPRKRCLAMANAAKVPRMVAAIVASTPIFRLISSESQMPETPHGSFQASNENRTQV